MSKDPSSFRRSSKSKKSSRSGSGPAYNLDFMKGATNFTVGGVSAHHADGDYYDNSVKNTHNDYSRSIKHEFHNQNSRAPIFNGTVEGQVANYDGGFVMSNSRGTVHADSYPIDDPREAPPRKPPFGKFPVRL